MKAAGVKHKQNNMIVRDSLKNCCFQKLEWLSHKKETISQKVVENANDSHYVSDVHFHLSCVDNLL